MEEQDFNKNNDKISDDEEHEKIKTLIDDLLEIEQNVSEFEIQDSKLIIEETEQELTIQKDQIVEDEKKLEIKTELDQNAKKPKFEKLKKIRIRRRKNGLKIETDNFNKEINFKQKEIKPTEFRIGFDENGNLTNLDLKKTKAKSKSEKSKKLGFLKKFRRKKKGEVAEQEITEGESKGSKIKGVFGKISRLKKAIPGKSKKTEKKE